MIKTIIILYSSKKEANSLLNQSILKFKRTSDKEYCCEYNKKKIILLITGIGKKSKKIHSFNNSDKSSLIIKAGSCAILDDNIPLLKPIIPEFIGYENKTINLDFSFFNIRILKKIKLMIINKGLITVKKPLLNKKKGKEYFNNNFVACDMETFYLIEKYKNTPFIPLLVGTDRGNTKSIVSFFKNISKASEILKDQIINFVTE